MKKLLIALCLTLATGVAFAKEEKTATPQQTKMQNCNKDAKEKALKGAEPKKLFTELNRGRRWTNRLRPKPSVSYYDADRDHDHQESD